MSRTDRKPLKEKFHRLISGTSAFWQLITLFGALLAVTALFLVVTNRQYTNILEDNLLKQTETAFRQDCQALSSAIHNAFSVQNIIEQAEDYRLVRQLAAGQLSSTTKAVVLSKIRTVMQETLAVSSYSDSILYFLYMPGIDGVCTREQVFFGAEAFVESCYDHSGQIGEALNAWSQVSGFIMILPSQPMTFNGKDIQGVTILLHSVRTQTVLGMVIPEETIAEYFHLSSLPDTACLTIVSADGTPIYTYGQEGRTDRSFTDNIWGTKSTATIGIPQQYFTELTRPARTTGLSLLGVMVVIGLILCVCFSGISVSPIRRLLSDRGAPGTSRNEFRRLAELLSNSDEEYAAVSRALSSNVLVRVLSGGILSEKEEKKLLQTYPILSGICRIAIAHTTAANPEIQQYAITELLQQYLPASFACGTVNRLESGILMPDDPEAIHQLAAAIEKANAVLAQDETVLSCGVSAPFDNVHGAYAAVRQARFSLPIQESSFIDVYSTETADNRPGVFSWLTHERLYQALKNNNREDVLQFIQSLADVKYSVIDAKEVYYNIRFVIRSTAKDLEMPLPEADALEYQEAMLPRGNFQRLEAMAELLFDRLHNRNELGKKDWRDAIARYVADNFRNPGLCAAEVATYFNVPAKSVYDAVREQTGLNFNDYLVTIRMKESAYLLCTTEASVDEIALLCGYPAQSTFYRVFKKYYNTSPNQYRSLHCNE